MSVVDLGKSLGEALVPDNVKNVQRRLGVVASAASGTPPTVSVTVGTTTITNVRYLGPWQPLTGDLVVVDFNGPDPLIIGKPASQNAGPFNEGQLVATPGIELYHPTGTPYIDLHHGANPAGDSNADYSSRLILVGPGTVQVQTAGGLSWLLGGSIPYGINSFISLDTDARSWGSLGNYVLLASSIETFINAPSGGTGHLRVNNNDIAIWDGVTGWQPKPVTARIRQTVSQSIPNTADTLIGHQTTDWSRFNAGSTGGNMLIAPIAGFYLCWGMVRMPPTTGGEHYTGLYFYNSGGGFLSRHGNHGGPSASITTTQVVMTVHLMAAGDRVALVHFQSSGGAISTDPSFGDIVLGYMLVGTQ